MSFEEPTGGTRLQCPLKSQCKRHIDRRWSLTPLKTGRLRWSSSISGESTSFGWVLVFTGPLSGGRLVREPGAEELAPHAERLAKALHVPQDRAEVSKGPWSAGLGELGPIRTCQELHVMWCSCGIRCRLEMSREIYHKSLRFSS